jgi:putative pyruvate formate lyase activating enzyme
MKTLLQNLSYNNLDSLITRAASIAAAGECCPRRCSINRAETLPPCGAQQKRVRAAAFHPHRGEEPPVSGTNGAGNVFFSGCTLACVFCQNYPFSHYNNGNDYSIEQFAGKLLELQAKGVHNLNFTTFDHYLSEVLCALRLVKDEIRIPIANNCSGFFLPDTLDIALSFCDIFLYDVKYADGALASRYSAGSDYVERNRAGLAMFRARGLPWVEENELLRRGLIIRHLVLPGALANSLAVMDDLARRRDGGLDFALSLMSQYFPAFRSGEFPEIDRKLSAEEYDQALARMEELGFEGWAQDPDGDGGC